MLDNIQKTRSSWRYEGDENTLIATQDEQTND